MLLTSTLSPSQQDTRICFQMKMRPFSVSFIITETKLFSKACPRRHYCPHPASEALLPYSTSLVHLMISPVHARLSRNGKDRESLATPASSFNQKRSIWIWPSKRMLPSFHGAEQSRLCFGNTAHVPNTSTRQQEVPRVSSALGTLLNAASSLKTHEPKSKDTSFTFTQAYTSVPFYPVSKQRTSWEVRMYRLEHDLSTTLG